MTDGYALAFSVAAVLLLVTAAVALATLPSLRDLTASTQASREVAVPVLELEEA